MSIFSRDQKPTASFVDALKQVASSGIQTQTEQMVKEENIHVAGYGIVSHDRAVHEAHASMADAAKHSAAGNHGGAAYHHERAAMFHKAIHAHMSAKGMTESTNEVAYNHPLGTPHAHPTKEKLEIGIEHLGGSPDYHAVRKHLEQKGIGHHVHHVGISSDNKTAQLTSNTLTTDELKRHVMKEETKEPDVGRVENKYKRHLARNMKKKDTEKKEKGEDKWK
jgi:hypothetical protein